MNAMTPRVPDSGLSGCPRAFYAPRAALRRRATALAPVERLYYAALRAVKPRAGELARERVVSAISDTLPCTLLSIGPQHCPTDVVPELPDEDIDTTCTRGRLRRDARASWHPERAGARPERRAAEDPQRGAHRERRAALAGDVHRCRRHAA